MYRQATVGRGREDIDVDLANTFGGALPVLPAQQPEADHESYLAIMPGKVLAAIYDRWGTRLLEQNVRVFLQHRGKVNKGIRATIENEPNMFFAYNNGITATAEEVDIDDDGGRLLLRRLKNFQIVNGGQTTASIHSAQRRQVDVSQAFVQMKLSVVDPERANSLVPKISEFANSQNRVSAADFFANHPFHVRMEEFSRRIHAPSPDGTFRQSKWFYERARGQYADARGGLTQAQRKKFDLENRAGNFSRRRTWRSSSTSGRNAPRRSVSGRRRTSRPSRDGSASDGRSLQTISTRAGTAKLLARRSSSRQPSESSRTNPGTKAGIAPTSSPTRSPRWRTMREKPVERSTSRTSGAGRDCRRPWYEP